MKTDWDMRFLRLAREVGSWSKDPSTKVGAVIVRNNRTVASLGYNGFPRGVSDEPSRYEDRELKYSLVVHAEMNAILSASEPVRGHTLYATLCPCNECAKAIVQSGIKRVVYLNTPCLTGRLKTSAFNATRLIFEEAGIPSIGIPSTLVCDE